MYDIRMLWLVRGGQTGRYCAALVLWAGDDKEAGEQTLTDARAAWHANPNMFCAPDGRAPRMESWLCAVRFDGEAVAEVIPIVQRGTETGPDLFAGATFAIARDGEAAAGAR